MDDWTVFETLRVDGSTHHYCEPVTAYIPRAWHTIVVAGGLTEPEARAMAALLNAGEHHES